MKTTIDDFLRDESYTLRDSDGNMVKVIDFDDAREMALAFARYHVEQALRMASSGAMVKVTTTHTFMHDSPYFTNKWIDSEGNEVEPDRKRILNTPYIVK